MEHLIEKYQKYSRRQCLKIFNDIIDKKNQDIQFGLMSSHDISEILQDSDEGVVLANVIVRENVLPPFKEKKKIVLQNCVIIGNLQVYDAKEIVIQNCFVFGSLVVWADLCLLSIEETMIDSIVLRFGKYHVFGNCVSLGTLSSEAANVTLGNLMCCCIRSFLMGSSEVILESKFCTKFEVKNSLSGKWVGEWKNFPISLSKIPFSKIDLKDYPKGEVGEKKEKVDNIFDFFEKNKLCVTVDHYADLIYYKNKQGLSGLHKVCYILCGGMIRPRVIFSMLLFVILGFALIYCFGLENPFGDLCVDDCENVICAEKKILELLYLGTMDVSLLDFFDECGKAICVGNNFLKSLYFSVITITTVGYGDITPVGWARLFACLEGIFGVLSGGAFLLAFTRKYLNRYDK